jgi:hypothetical protein
VSGRFDVAVVGGGFAGLSAAMAAARGGKKVVLLEAEDSLGGLGGTFAFGDGVEVEKFYHHWFTNDVYVPQLVDELGMTGDVVTMASRTGMYLNGKIWSLSTPQDLLRFTALPLLDRIRLGLSTLRVRRVKDWSAIEQLSIREWLEPLCGPRAYAQVWEPLVRAKFGRTPTTSTPSGCGRSWCCAEHPRLGRSGAAGLLQGRFRPARRGDRRGHHARGGQVRLGEAVLGVETDGDRVTALAPRRERSRRTTSSSRRRSRSSLTAVREAGPTAWVESLRRCSTSATSAWSCA